MTSPRELIIDSFAGGGASLGIERALGRSPDIAINHDAEALAMHAANHPATRHLPHNVWKVDPAEVCAGRPVGLLWASPDCKHHSKAKGGKPVKREIRDLAWVVVRWARQVRPRVICLENVEEFRHWGPLTAAGLPCPERKGQTFAAWVGELTRLGYRVEHRELRACDYGAPTIRKRLFVVARRDGRPIVWPEATHGAPQSAGVLAGTLLPWRTAAQIIDWSRPCPSIFLTREEARAIGVNRPLAENTLARIAKGVKRYVFDAAEPFIVPVTHAGDARVHGLDEPLRTVTTAQRGEHALVAPYLVPRYGERPPTFECRACGEVFADPHATGAGTLAPAECPRCGEENAIVERPGQEPRTRSVEEPAPVVVPTANGGSLVAAHLTKFHAGQVGASLDDPLPTVTSNSFIKRPGGAPPIGVVSAFLAQHNTDMVGHDAREPVSTIVQKGSTQGVVEASFLSHAYTSNTRGGEGDLLKPIKTILAGGTHAAEVRAFLIKYYGADQDPRLEEPLHTATTKARFGLVHVHGETYEIVDIGMRMLTPRELFRAQGFPDSYIIDQGVSVAGEPVALTKTAQVRMCGNSVCPPLAEALVRANYIENEAPQRRAPPLRAAPLFDPIDAGAPA